MPKPLAIPRSPAPPLAPSNVRARASYDVVRRLGVSPTSEVLLAVSRGPLGFERTVVLKRLRVEVSGDACALASARLGREALAYARLAHPSIVRLYDFVEDEGRLTLVLEHVDGLSLARVVSGLRAQGDALGEQAIWYVGYRLFQALAAAHSARDPVTREFAPVIHRDVSPANVLVPWEGYAKLSDFGVARLAGVAGDTRPGVVKGTVGYLAPEQVRGEPATVRTDVYAACLVMRELLLREPVFPSHQRSELEVLGAMAMPSLEPLAALRPALPAHVTDAIDRGLSPDPEERSITADEMVGLLRGVVGDVEVAREQLVAKVGRLRGREDMAARNVAYATRPDGDGPGEVSLFGDSAPTLDDLPETETATAPAFASMVVPRARPVVAWNPAHPSAILAIEPPPQTARMVDAPARPPPPPPPAPPAPREPPRDTFVSRPSSSLIHETPHAMATPLPDLGRDVEGERNKPTAPRRRPPRSHGLMVVAAAAAIAMGILIGGVLGMRERASAVSARTEARATAGPTAPAAPPLAVSPPAPPPPAPLPPQPAPASPARPAGPALAAGTGRVVTPASAKGHRVFVDGRVAGSGGAPLVVRCGKHDVRVGSAGRLVKVEVPCGGDLEVSR